MRKKSASPEVSVTGGAKPELYLPDNYRADESVGYLVRVLHQSLQRHIDQRMQPYDLTAMQWGPLFLLAQGKGNTAALLAREAGTDAGAMTRMLDRLEAKGLVRRVRSAEDRRVVHLELTADGINATGQIPQGLCGALNHHLQGFSQTELDHLKSLLRRMITNGQQGTTTEGELP